MGDKTMCEMFWWKPQRKKPFRRQSHRRKTNTESDLKQMASDVVKGIRVDRVMDKWQVLCKDGFELKFP
jgi:hypothetical protein